MFFAVIYAYIYQCIINEWEILLNIWIRWFFFSSNNIYLLSMMIFCLKLQVPTTATSWCLPLGKSSSRKMLPKTNLPILHTDPRVSWCLGTSLVFFTCLCKTLFLLQINLSLSTFMCLFHHFRGCIFMINAPNTWYKNSV